MSWAGLASNQCISCNNLQDAVDTSVFVLKNSIPVSTKQITKAEAENYVYINTITSKTSNQLPVKSNLTAATALAYSYTLFWDYSDVDVYVGFDTSGQACAATTNSITVYSSSSTIGIGTALYTDIYGTEPLLATCINQIYFRIGVNYVTFEPSAPLQGDGYIINLVGSCGEGVVFNTLSGLYPVSGPSSTCIGNIINYTSSSVFIRGLFNSAGVAIGTDVNDNIAYYQSFSIEVSGETITSFGQDFYTSTGTQAPFTGYAVVGAGQTMSFTLDKFDGLDSGSTFRLAYATVSSAGPYITI